MSDDLYKVLGAARDATKEQLKKAFRKKAKAAHPDKDGGDHGEMVALNKAMEILGDDVKRKRYDETGEAETSKEPTIEDKARMSLAKAFDDLMGDEVSWEPHEDPLDRLKRGIAAALDQYNFELKKLDSYLKKLETKAGKVKLVQGDGADLWAGVVAERRQRYTQKRAHVLEMIEITKLAQELVKDYKAEVAPFPAPSPSKKPSFDSIFNNYGAMPWDQF